MRASALVFDFNGTLSDDEPVLLAVYQELFAEHGRPLPAERYFAELCGHTEETIISGWLGVEGVELDGLVAERIRRYIDRAADGSTILPEVREAVRYAAERVPVAVCSGAFRAEIEPVVAGAGLAEAIGFLVTAEDVDTGKPAPDGYLKAIERLGLDATGIVAFEDTEAGVASAKAAGLRCLAVRTTLPAERLRLADELVDGIDLALVRRLVG
ncbi:MAG: HAD family phosphatase [Gaiellales bacterium]